MVRHYVSVEITSRGSDAAGHLATEFQAVLDRHAEDGHRLHSWHMNTVPMKGDNGPLTVLVAVFEKGWK